MAKDVPLGFPKNAPPARITTAKREIFLAQLGETCNVRASCAVARVDHSSMYALRARDADFANQWREAVEEGYLRIESELMRQALGNPAAGEGDRGAVADEQAASQPGEGAGQDPAPFDRELALRMLTLRRQADSQGRRSRVRLRQPDAADALKALHKKLAAFEKRSEKKR